MNPLTGRPNDRTLGVSLANLPPYDLPKQQAQIAMNADRIPVLDIGDYLAGRPGARQSLANAVATTCDDTGFLVIANHGIDPALVEDAFAAAFDFFDMDEQHKLALKIGDLNIGYLPYGAQIVRTPKVHANKKPNYSESFYILTDLPSDDPRIVSCDPLYSLNKWPPQMPLFRACAMAYFTAMRPLAHQMVSVIATSSKPARRLRVPACELLAHG
jgi:isopenicillin N synthase-like dioxygenase